MTQPTKKVRGIDWAAIFERRPDLESPGFQELLDQIREEARYTDDSPPGYNGLLTQVRKEQSDAKQQSGND